MKKIFHIAILSISFTLISCMSQKQNIQSISFKTDYKFNSAIRSKLEKDTTTWKYQAAAADYASKGDHKSSLEQWDLAIGTTEKSFMKSQVDSINLKYKKVNAIDYIVEQSKNNKIIIINEAHHNAFHRVFTKSLLKQLFDNGYRILALEALSYEDDMDSLQKTRKYPVKKTGDPYIKEPQFGNLVRDAIQIGYKLYPYETKNDEFNGKLREIDQARNIQKIISTHPNEKFLIHCGFNHVLEGEHSFWEKAMAERLKEYTKINPLTIDQESYSEKSKPEFNDPLLKALKITESSVLLDRNGQPYKYQDEKAYTDITVFHPNTIYYNNRPDWIYKNENEKVTISLKDIAIAFPVMVLAYNKGENINNAIPVDITEVQSDTKCVLGLKKGDYTIVVTNGNESVQLIKKVI